jgi:hypothetical protein
MSTDSGDVPFLHWMLIGHTEPFEVWMHVRLTWAVADELASVKPASVDEILRQLPGHDVRFVLSDATRPLVVADWTIPARSASLIDGLRMLTQRLVEDAKVASPDADALELARRDIESMVAV